MVKGWTSFLDPVFNIQQAKKKNNNKQYGVYICKIKACKIIKWINTKVEIKT